MTELLDLFNDLHQTIQEGSLVGVDNKLWTIQGLVIPQQPKFGKRSPEWDDFRDECVKEHPFCAACGGTKELQAHHKKPYHLYPKLELVKKNIIILCMHPSHYCHFVLGHAFNWSDFNLRVELSAKILFDLVQNRKHAS